MGENIKSVVRKDSEERARERESERERERQQPKREKLFNFFYQNRIFIVCRWARVGVVDVVTDVDVVGDGDVVVVGDGRSFFESGKTNPIRKINNQEILFRQH